VIIYLWIRPILMQNWVDIAIMLEEYFSNILNV